MTLGAVILFLFGLSIGSFINVFAVRYNPEKFLFSKQSLKGRSHCPYCKKILRWYELIPLFSFICLLARCHHCRKSINWQYPIVELLVGLIFLLPAFFYFYFQITQHILVGDLLVWYYWFAGAWVLAGILLILLSIIDWRTYLIPDEIVIGLTLLGILITSLKAYYLEFFSWKVSFLGHYAQLISLPFGIWGSHLFAGVIGFSFFGLIYLLTRGRGMGFGDVKLAGALGLLLGWPDTILAFAIAFIVGSVIGVMILILKRKKFEEPIPFGPYLVASTFAVIFFGYYIIDNYFKLFGIFQPN